MQHFYLVVSIRMDERHWAYAAEDLQGLEDMSFKRMLAVCASETTCIEWCMRVGLLKPSMNCRCSAPMTLYSESKRWRCMKTECNVEVSVTKNSFFYRSKLPISSIVMFLYMYCSELPATCIGQLLELSPKTVSDWCNSIREVCSKELQRCPIKIGEFYNCRNCHFQQLTNVPFS
jgi:hypothetical protein